MQKFVLSFPRSQHKHLNVANKGEKLSRVQAMLSVPKLFKQLRFHLWTECLSGNPVKLELKCGWSTVTQLSQWLMLTNTGSWHWCPGKRSTSLSHCEIRTPLSEPRHSLTTSSRNMLLFVGVYITAGWESPAMGNQCILPAIRCFHPLIHKFLPKFHPILLPTSPSG